MTKNQYIKEINEIGQSIWYDNLSLDVLRSGELKRLLDCGVSGLTSNPTIFKKAIADTSHYDEKIAQLAQEGGDADQICETLMIDDVGAAADLLRETYENTQGRDGYASIEVSPKLAHDVQGTVAAAVRLWKRLQRPNIMIKIPATDAGIDAIEQVLSKGINVNVTLIFSCNVYTRVANAYINALQNLDDAQRNAISSVASFFVSRVDSIAERELTKKKAELGPSMEQFIGTVGIANSKCAYQRFQEIFSESAFTRYGEQGARVQRPLWASTGTKNPDFSPVLYVEELIGAETVNTLPPQTLNSLLEHATVRETITTAPEAATTLLENLAQVGVNLEALLEELQRDGVEAFVQSYEELIAAVEQKRSQLTAA
jgi:transaldolase